MKKAIALFLGLMLIMLALTACREADITPAAEVSPAPAPSSASETIPTPTPEPPIAEARLRPETDREGYAITLPDEINTIISIGPSNTEVLVALGFGDMIISADQFSYDVVGIAEGIAVLNMMSLDAEFIIDLEPDIIFITGMTRTHGDDHPLRLVSDTGIAVIYMPSSVSIAAVMEDIRFMAAVMDAYEAGETIIADMQAEMDIISTIAATITETKTVYFEISPLWTLGSNTFIHEMIEFVGAVNIFADENSWTNVSEEAVLEANPDVILTSTNFLDDPIAEIMDRPGWGAITAVQNYDVFPIDTASSNRPSHNIVRALREIAEAVFPEYFG